MPFRLLFIGDVVGKPGRQLIREHVPRLKEQHALDFVVVNGENAASGSGITPRLFRQIVEPGVDVVTLGDHYLRRKDIIPTLREDERLIRPANFPARAPGRGWTQISSRAGIPVVVVNLLGTTYMRAANCPYQTIDHILEQLDDQTKLIIVDLHAEATGEKQSLARYLDGRVSAVLGTHTHVPTADEQVLPGGTAFISDVGMTGPYHSILGRQIEAVLQYNVTTVPTPFLVAHGQERLCGCLVDLDIETGRALAIERVCAEGIVDDEQGDSEET